MGIGVSFDSLYALKILAGKERGPLTASVAHLLLRSGTLY